MRTTAPSPHFFTNCFEWRHHLPGNDVAKSDVALGIALVMQGVAFAEVFYGDDGI
jgi:hypothetical protein